MKYRKLLKQAHTAILLDMHKYKNYKSNSIIDLPVLKTIRHANLKLSEELFTDDSTYSQNSYAELE